METEEQVTSGEIATEETQPEPASPAAQPADTEQPAAPAKQAPVAVVDEHGPIPFERHEAILGKTRRDYEDRIARTSWADGLTREEVERAIALDRIYRTNPERLAAHLSERVKATAKPEPDVKDKDTGDWFYSPQQAERLTEWRAGQLVESRMREFEERFGPIESEFTQSRQMAAMNSQISEAEQWPGFTENLTEITAAITEVNDRRARGERVPKLSLHEAYIRVVPSKLAATQESLIAERVKKALTELNTTTERVKDDVNPGRSPASTRKTEAEMSDAELLEYFSKQSA